MTEFATLKDAIDANASEPYRVRQRLCALRLGLHQDTFTNKELRELCKEFDCFNSPNFTRNLKQDTEYFTGDTKAGWALTDHGRSEAETLFGSSGVSADVVVNDDCACDGDPDEDEAAFDPTCDVHGAEPVEVAPPAYVADVKDELDSILATPVAEQVPAPVTVAPAPVAPKAPAPQPVARRVPRVLAKNALASVFKKIKDEEKAKQ